MKLLEQVAGKERRGLPQHRVPYAEAILASQPFAYWRLDDLEAVSAVDSSKNGRNASYEGGVAMYLPGAPLAPSSHARFINRAVHLAGGRLTAAIEGLGQNYTVELWFWNGLSHGARPVTGDLLSFAGKEANSGSGVELAIGGTATTPGRLVFSTGSTAIKNLVGKTGIAPETWHHLALVCQGNQAAVYFDGNREPEIAGEVPADQAAKLHVGGRSNSLTSFEGKIDEVAIFDRVLSSAEITGHFQASGSHAKAE